MEKSNKRIYRNDMPETQKQAISAALKGRKHTEQHKVNISKGLIRHWSSLPLKPVNNNTEKTGTEDIYGDKI